MQHTCARQSVLPEEARLAEGSSLPHSHPLGGYKGDARARLKRLGESKLVAATHSVFQFYFNVLLSFTSFQ